ncbi:MAG TPA: ABC transporter permease [Candidatus Limnocylindrales bacterium]|nr:ABC transporter permease [Candidatus Limnocylindrales bacterium]
MKPLAAVLARGLVGAAFGIALAFLLVPLLALVLHTTPGDLLDGLRSPVVTEAIRLSLVTTVGTLVLTVLFGLPAAWALARWRVPGRPVIEAALALPMVLPPVVAGVALLVTVGANGTFGGVLRGAGIRLTFTLVAVVLAQTFVSAPFFITSARAGFEALDSGWEETARSLGASRTYAFWRVVVPLTAPALVAGLGLTWARALGEFGATITFAGNLMGVTQTMPLAVFVSAESDLRAAITLAVILLALAFAVLVALRSVPLPGRAAA